MLQDVPFSRALVARKLLTFSRDVRRVALLTS
jgi:hypothetical protein